MARNSLRVIIGDLWFAFAARLRRSRLAPESSRRLLPLQSRFEDAERTRNRQSESALYDATGQTRFVLVDDGGFMMLACRPQSARRNATRSAFSCAVRPIWNLVS
jgi:hypothetical protein